jgi:hypothetical protein
VNVAAYAAPAPEPTPPPVLSGQNAVFVELLGSGLVYSINYERILATVPVGLRAGASFFTYKVSQAMGSGNLTLATFPLLASYYLGVACHKLELGLGATFLYSVASSDANGIQYGDSGLGVAASGVVGYRYLPDVRGVTFGAGFTPLVRPGKPFLPWGGVNVGYAF